MHVCAYPHVSRYMCGAIHACTHMCIYVCRHVCVCMCGSQRLTWNVFLEPSLPNILKQGLSLGELSDLASPADLALHHQPPPPEITGRLP